MFLRSGHNVPSSIKTNVILSSDKKEQGPKAQPSPSEIQALVKRKGVPAGAVTLPREHTASTQVWILPLPSPAEEAALSWRCPQVSRPYPVIITEDSSCPSGSSGCPNQGCVP